MVWSKFSCRADKPWFTHTDKAKKAAKFVCMSFWKILCALDSTSLLICVDLPLELTNNLYILLVPCHTSILNSASLQHAVMDPTSVSVSNHRIADWMIHADCSMYLHAWSKFPIKCSLVFYPCCHDQLNHSYNLNSLPTELCFWNIVVSSPPCAASPSPPPPASGGEFVCLLMLDMSQFEHLSTVCPCSQWKVGPSWQALPQHNVFTYLTRPFICEWFHAGPSVSQIA